MKINDWQKFEVTMLLNVLEQRHLKANDPLEFKFSYRFKRIKEKFKIDTKELEGKKFSEAKELLEVVLEEVSFPQFTMQEVEERNLKLISEEIEIFKILISDYSE